MSHLLNTYARFPVTFVRGAGEKLWDDEGNEYLDFLSGISVSSVGHAHPSVVAAIQEQAARLLHVGNLYFNAPMVALADRLAQSSLGGGVFFTNSGAEAVEAALKLARKARRGGEIVVIQGGFHGRTYGALSATPQESKQAPFAPLVPGFVVVPPDAEAIANAVTDRTAAVLCEPIRGESGVHPLSHDALHAAREACDAHGAALIFDEIQTGLARTGRMWAYEWSGVVPDALTTAKALGGGLPIGALVTGPRLRDVLQPGDHGSTFAGGPVVAAAAHAVLDLLEREDLHARVRELGERLVEALREIPQVVEVRGRGLMVGFDLEPGVDAVAAARAALLDERLVVNATGPSTLRMLPPLIIDDSHVDDAVGRISRVLAAG